MDAAVARIAAAIGEPARARMLVCLMDGRARTATELALVAEVSPSTASVHLTRLKAHNLVLVAAQGKHRYYKLQGPAVARVVESLGVLGGANTFSPNTPNHLRAARTCYDHIAGALGVSLLDRFLALKWLRATSQRAYTLTPLGTKSFEACGIDLADTRTLRRQFAYPCLDWSERRPHLAGALGAALLRTLLAKRWLSRDLDTRALAVTSLGRRELQKRFGLSPAPYFKSPIRSGISANT